ncbi:uncharacterized protein [Rutidosis leptorrhynchoides]|uniref:uncharacterized protein n=1 Tax=Rutidosis leptorrhynchoides TaxID=125765 RepID=UPI003A9A3C9D
MKEVVKKEVIKLLDAGLIYPISDSPWVSAVQVVPKKGGTTMILKDQNEFVPTRIITGWLGSSKDACSISSDMVEDTMEVFMDDFSVFGDSFDHCLKNLDKMLTRCKNANLVLN